MAPVPTGGRVAHDEYGAALDCCQSSWLTALPAVWRTAMVARADLLSMRTMWIPGWSNPPRDSTDAEREGGLWTRRRERKKLNAPGRCPGVPTTTCAAASPGSKHDEEIVEMNNGCLCCTVRGDLNRHLMNLLQQRERFAHVLVETTGLANPGPVALTFLWDQKVQQAFTLYGIVTVVDARHIVRHLEECEEARAQIVFAD